ncbi:MAG: hypothetical protein NC041_07015 [Bacteroides sp.]|nr:hypothetical protein [Prevotella sp.]MCM1407047.1 hypothetical protein [Treponema brennaborense]MCM1470199.1 hypothetical protein [Bacteroides sp.]
MKDFRNLQYVRIITEEGIIANGDYITDDVVIRCKNGLLCDLPGEDGILLPAIETRDGSHSEHWKNGVLHCENAPAVVDNIDKYELWFINGTECPPQK